jgi:hypothetical protein
MIIMIELNKYNNNDRSRLPYTVMKGHSYRNENTEDSFLLFRYPAVHLFYR